MNVVLDYAAKSASVDETIVYPNHTGQPLQSLVLAVEPNLWPNCFSTSGISVDGVPASNYSLDGQKLELKIAPDTGALISKEIDDEDDE